MYACAVAEQLETDQINVLGHLVIVSFAKHHVIVKNPRPISSNFVVFFSLNRNVFRKKEILIGLS